MNVLKKMMLSCARASELIEKRNVQPLSRAESVQLFFHTRMCGACRSYELQSSFIDQALEKILTEYDHKLPEGMLKPDAYVRIMRSIKKD